MLNKSFSKMSAKLYICLDIYLWQVHNQKFSEVV